MKRIALSPDRLHQCKAGTELFFLHMSAVCTNCKVIAKHAAESGVTRLHPCSNPMESLTMAWMRSATFGAVNYALIRDRSR